MIRPNARRLINSPGPRTAPRRTPARNASASRGQWCFGGPDHGRGHRSRPGKREGGTLVVLPSPGGAPIEPGTVLAKTGGRRSGKEFAVISCHLAMVQRLGLSPAPTVLRPMVEGPVSGWERSYS